MAISKRFFCLALLGIIPVFIFSQHYMLDTEYPTIIFPGEPFRLTFSALTNGEVELFHRPNINNSGLEIISGPALSISSMAVMKDGIKDSRYTYEYVYMLRADTAGIYEIGPASVRTKDGERVFVSLPVSVHVMDSSVIAAGTPGEEPVTEPDLFIKVYTDKEQVSSGEPVRLYYEIFSRGKVMGYKDTTYPDFEGVRTMELNTSHYTWEQAIIHSMPWYTLIIKEYVLFPERTGEIRIAPLEMTVETITPGAEKRISGLDEFFGKKTVKNEKSEKRVASEPITIQVLE